MKIVLAGQIARALAVFSVDEIVIFEDGSGDQHARDCEKSLFNGAGHDRGDSYTGYSHPNHFLMHILSFLETPPHLRKHLFPIHPNLKLAGTLPSLDMPHHLRTNEWCQYREGITLKDICQNHDSELPTLDGSRKRKKKPEKPVPNTLPTSTLVDCGLPRKASVPTLIPQNTRVTLKFPDNQTETEDRNATIPALAVAPSTPRQESGYYWGYTVRYASCLSAVFTECSFDEGYDMAIGASERGKPMFTFTEPTSGKPNLPQVDHTLICFGGVAGLEAAIAADGNLQRVNASPETIFDAWVNLCPGQGSRTIRTEEAVWLGLMWMRDVQRRMGRI